MPPPLIKLVSKDNLTVYETTMQALATNFRGKLRKVNDEAIRKISEEAEKNFAESILRPETSATLGGASYRSTSSASRGEGGRLTGRRGSKRVSGNFTFGPGKTFTGALLKNKGPHVTGFGYPIVARADKATKRVWRGLEFGWKSMKMPTGVWRDAEGNKVSTRSPGGDAFFPAGPIERTVAGIEAKLFITKAFDTVFKGFVEPKYREAAESAAREESGKTLSK